MILRIDPSSGDCKPQYETQMGFKSSTVRHYSYPEAADNDVNVVYTWKTISKGITQTLTVDSQTDIQDARSHRELL